MLSSEDYQLVQADLRKYRVDPNPPKPGPLHSLRALLSLAPTNYFGTKPIFIDVNTIHQKIKWDLMVNSPIVGVLDKMGEWDGTAGPDSWMNPNFSASCQGAADTGRGFVGFIFSQCGAEQLNDQMTMTDVNEQFDCKKRYGGRAPTDDERVFSLLNPVNGDNELRIIVRQWAIGDSWQSNPAWLKTAHFRRIQKIVIDAERYWRDYNKYLAFLRGQVTADQVVKIDPPWIAFSVKTLYERVIWLMAHGYLPQVDVEVVYSGNWFIKAYSPTDLGTFLETKETWPAIWYWAKANTCTVEELVTNYLGAIPDTWRDTASFKNAMFGIKQRWLQLGVFVLPVVTDMNGNPTGVDVDVYVGGDDWKTWMKLTDVPPVVIPPETTPDLAAITARVKALEDAAPVEAARMTAIEGRTQTIEDLRGKLKDIL